MYFRKTAVNGNKDSVGTDVVESRTRKELLIALESVRTRLAVSIALEKKYTLPALWNYYLETADQMCRSIRKLRMMEDDGSTPDGWIRALETLKKIPADERAHRLCRILREVVAELE